MKTTLIITAATLACALLIKLLMNKQEVVEEMLETAPVKKGHHITDVFAHAKNYSE